MPNTLRLIRRQTVNMPVAAFFDAATMTDRVERLAGLPAARFTMGYEPGGRQALRADAHLLGVPVLWYELPFEWVSDQYWRVHRIFEGVPLRWITITTTVTPAGPEQTQVEIDVEVLPSNIFGRVGAFFVFGVFTLTRMMAVYRQLSRRYQAQEESVFPPRLRAPVRRGELELGTRTLQARGLPAAHIDRLREHLIAGLDDELKGMRPLELADRWGIPRLAALRLFLYATRAGLLDLHWDVLCPNCRISKRTLTSLADLTLEAHCDTCNIHYDVNFDEYVELRFTVSPAVRAVNNTVFCIAAPYQTRHIYAQVVLPPGATQTVTGDLKPGAYRWRTRQRAERGGIHVTPAGADGPFTVIFQEDSVQMPAGEPSIAPNAALIFTNHSPTALLVIVEQARWDSAGASAALVSSIQEFREMFSSQVLAPGLGVSMRNLTVLFSDLKDSTLLYDRVGDAVAYARVRDHFVILRDAITAHDGAIVKTSGDSMMAVFSAPTDAVRACLEIQARIAGYNQRIAADPLLVKLGLHRGPCIAINANDVLDYFGSTVNTASRVHGAGEGADLIFTDRVYEDPAVQEVLSGYPVEEFTAPLKGLSLLPGLYRVRGTQVTSTYRPRSGQDGREAGVIRPLVHEPAGDAGAPPGNGAREGT